MPFLEESLIIPFKRVFEDVMIPLKMYSDSAGHDLFASETVKLCARGRVFMSVNLHMAIRKWFYGKIARRSGLAKLHGVVAFNGTIDAGYRGIICVLLFNFSDDDYIVEKGNRIAQIIIQKCYNINLVDFGEIFEGLKLSERGGKGFGSSLGS